MDELADGDFVRDPTTLGTTLKDAGDAMVVAAFHEGVHIHQFVKAGKPPQTESEMMGYEQQAYRKTQTWLSTTQAAKLIPDPQDLMDRGQEMKMYADAFDAEIARVNGLNLPAKKKDAEFKAFLLGRNKIGGNGEKMLPPYTNLPDLYR